MAKGSGVIVRVRPMVLRFWMGVTAGFVLMVAATLMALTLVPVVLGLMSATVVGTASMAPALQVGDVVLLDHVDARELVLQPPTVVLVDDPTRDQPLLHRIVGTSPDGQGYLTKGDANTEPDSAVALPQDVRGTGRVIIPVIGHPILWLQDGNLIAVALLLMTVAGLSWVARFGWSDAYDPWAANNVDPRARPEPPGPPSGGPLPRPVAPSSRRVVRVAGSAVVAILACTGLTQAVSGGTGVPVAAAAFMSSTSDTGNLLQTQVLDPPTSLAASTQCGATTTPTAVWSDTWAPAGSVTWTPSSAGVLQAGDLVLTQQVMRRTYGYAGPAGWDLVVEIETGTSNSNDFVTRIWSRVLTSSDLNTTFTWWYSGGHADLGFVAVRGASGVSSHTEAVRVASNFSSVTAPSAPVGANNSLLASFGWANADSILAIPSGMTQRYRNAASGSTWWVAGAVGAASTPSTGSRVFTLQNAYRASAANLVLSPLQPYNGSLLSWTHSVDAWATGYEIRKAGDSVWTPLPGKPSSHTVFPQLGVQTTYQLRSVAGTWRSTPSSVTTTATCP